MKKNILLCSYYYKPHSGGIENSLFYLALEYKIMGYNPIILCSDKGLDKKNRLIPIEDQEHITIQRFKHFQPWHPIFYPLAPFYEFWQIRKTLKKIPVIHKCIARNHLLALACESIGLITMYLIPSIIKYQDALEFENLASNRTFIRQVFDLYRKYTITYIQHLIQKYAVNNVTQLGVFSKTMSNQLLNLSSKEVLFFKPGVDQNRFNFQEDKDKLKKELGITNNRKIYLIVARLCKQKGIDIAINSFIQSNSKEILLIVGDGPEKSYLKTISEKNTNIIFAGVTNSPEKYYKIADFFILSSIYESFGQTLLEAMACGIFILGFNSSDTVKTATNEIVRNGKEGWLCDWGNLTELLKFTETLDKKELENKARDLSKMTLNEYSWNTLAKNLLI